MFLANVKTFNLLLTHIQMPLQFTSPDSENNVAATKHKVAIHLPLRPQAHHACEEACCITDGCLVN